AAAPPPAATAADEERLKRQVTEQVLRRMQPALAAANKTFPSQFNPAIGLILDNVFSYSEKDRGNFEFRAAELGLSASVDPFARGYAIITGSPDGFEVEEAAIVTTSLPYNLTLKGGRFFADFGRLSKFHDHDLPFVNRPKPPPGRRRPDVPLHPAEPGLVSRAHLGQRVPLQPGGPPRRRLPGGRAGAQPGARPGSPGRRAGGGRPAGVARLQTTGRGELLQLPRGAPLSAPLSRFPLRLGPGRRPP